MGKLAGGGWPAGWERARCVGFRIGIAWARMGGGRRRRVRAVSVDRIGRIEGGEWFRLEFVVEVG